MIRILLCFFVLFISMMNCFAMEPLVLSDVIREAREAQLKQIAQEKLEKLTPIKNKEVNINPNEKSACERINSSELMHQKN